jgi:hypothetical protein
VADTPTNRQPDASDPAIEALTLHELTLAAQLPQTLLGVPSMPSS